LRLQKKREAKFSFKPAKKKKERGREEYFPTVRKREAWNNHPKSATTETLGEKNPPPLLTTEEKKKKGGGKQGNHLDEGRKERTRKKLNYGRIRKIRRIGKPESLELQPRKGQKQ